MRILGGMVGSSLDRLELFERDDETAVKRGLLTVHNW